MNGNDDLEAVVTSVSDDESDDTDVSPDGREGNNKEQENNKMGFRMGSMGTQGDFTIIGYSSDAAMTDFINGTCSITEGTMFEEGTSSPDCVISDELASYNDISAGDTITIVNPNNEDESYEINVIGIYSNSQSTVSDGNMMGGFGSMSIPWTQKVELFLPT